MPTARSQGPIVLVIGLHLVASLAPVEAQESESLPRPPGVRLTTLPRAPEGQPTEVTVAIDPRDPERLIATYQQIVFDTNTKVHYGVRASVHAAWSADGGRSWTVSGGTDEKRYPIAVDASAAIDRHGHAFLAYLAMDAFPPRRSNPRNGMFVRRSLDGGRTWEASRAAVVEFPTNDDPPFQDKGFLVADTGPTSPHAGNLYLGWSSFTHETSEIRFARSTDDGRSWSRPITISTERGLGHDSAKGWAVGFHAAVAPDGTVYAVWVDGKGIVIAISRDGGSTFEPSRRVAPIATYPLFITEIPGFPFANGLPSAAVDRRGRLYVVWADRRGGDLDVMLATSDDRGRTWTTPKRVNDDPATQPRDQAIPWLGVDRSDGAVYVVFYDRRADPANRRPTVTLARSTDRGRTFTNYAWTVTPSDPTRAAHGDYIGVAALDGRVYGAWADNAAPGVGTDTPETPYVPSGPAVIRIGIADFRSQPRPRH